MKKWVLYLLRGGLAAGVCGLILVLGLNALVVGATLGRVYTPEEAETLEEVDCILVLGCGVRKDGSPTLMLRDRLSRGVELYTAGAAPKLLMSGDHSRPDYDEVNAMKDYAMGQGVPSSDVFMDHAGFSTYESLYRAKSVFGAKRVVIVTQRYHLFRALYIARRMGIEAYGVCADGQCYSGQTLRSTREMLARAKDVFYALLRPEPTYLGDPIPVSGNGDQTNDRDTILKENSQFLRNIPVFGVETSKIACHNK